MKKEYNIFGWGKWKDIEVFHFAGVSYLLQGRKKKNGKTKFCVRKQRSFVAMSSTLTIEKLKEADIWQQ